MQLNNFFAIAKGKRAVKTYYESGDREEYDLGYRMDFKQFYFSGIDDFYEVLKPFFKRQDCAMVRGALIHGDYARKARRLKDVTLKDHPHRWVMLDYDQGRREEWSDIIQDPAGAARAIRDLLPEGVKQARMVYQLGNSAGISPEKYSVHLFFMFEDPVSNDELKVFLREYGFDTCVTNVVQPYFIGDPVCIGFQDPIDQRWGMIEGTDFASNEPLKEAYRVETIMMEQRRAESKARAAANLARYGERGNLRYTTMLEVMKNEYAHLVTDGGRNGWLLCDCPNHDSSTKKSLHINIETEQWNCYGCRVSGGTPKQLVDFFTNYNEEKTIRILRRARDE